MYDLLVNIEVGYDSNGAMDFNQESPYNLKWTYVGYGSDDVLYEHHLVIPSGIPGNDILWGRGENAANANESWRVGDTAEYSGIKARYTISKKKTDVLNNDAEAIGKSSGIVAQNAKISLNGIMANDDGQKVVFMDPEKITITSSGDDSGVTFKISGILHDGTVKGDSDPVTLTSASSNGAKATTTVELKKLRIVVTGADTKGIVKVGLGGDGTKWAKTQIVKGTGSDAKLNTAPTFFTIEFTQGSAGDGHDVLIDIEKARFTDKEVFLSIRKVSTHGMRLLVESIHG